MLILVTGTFDVYKNGRPTGEKEYLVSHAIDYDTGRNVVVPCEHPATFPGAYRDNQLGAWVVPD